MRPIAGPDDENRAIELFLLAVHDDPDAFAELVPDATTPKPVAIADDGSAAEIDLYPYDADAWAPGPAPIRRVIVHEEKARASATQRSAS
jgi:hypothetical protein